METMDSRFPRISSKAAVIVVCGLLSCAAFSHQQQTRSVHAPLPQWKNEWTRGAVFYEVFVRSFQDSNGDGIGDLKGLISKLDYLNDGKPETTGDLDVDAVWLMPVFRSPSYHGYDTTDYLHINPDYGSDSDFDLLLKECHKRGIRVILDFVMNHTSSDHPWFRESQSSAESSKRNWYVWRPDNPGWMQPWSQSPTWHPGNGGYYYGIFWSGMPDLNFRNQAVRSQIFTIAASWLKRGADGFRLDATRYMVEDGPGAGQFDTPETHDFLRQLSLRVRKLKPQAALVGENWTDTPIIATYFGATADVAGGNELPMNFNFPLASSILQGIQSGNATGISAKIAEMQSVYPQGVNDAPFLTNHDMVRLATQFKKDMSSLRNAAFVLLTLPGAPFVYYGEEVGLENGPAQGDESKRTPMPWDNSPTGGFTTGNPWFPFAPGRDQANVADQLNDKASLLSLYRNLIHVRNGSEALKQGELQLLSATSGMSPVLAFLRKSPTEQVLVAINVGSSVVSGVRYSIPAISMERVFVDGAAMDPSGTSGNWTLSLPPHAAGIWRAH